MVHASPSDGLFAPFRLEEINATKNPLGKVEKNIIPNASTEPNMFYDSLMQAPKCLVIKRTKRQQRMECRVASPHSSYGATS